MEEGPVLNPAKAWAAEHSACMGCRGGGKAGPLHLCFSAGQPSACSQKPGLNPGQSMVNKLLGVFVAKGSQVHLLFTQHPTVPSTVCPWNNWLST